MQSVRTARPVRRATDRNGKTVKVGSYVYMSHARNHRNDTGTVTAIYQPRERDRRPYFMVKISDGPDAPGRTYQFDQRELTHLEG